MAARSDSPKLGGVRVRWLSDFSFLVKGKADKASVRLFQGNIWEQIFQVSFLLEMINTVPFIITVKPSRKVASHTHENLHSRESKHMRQPGLCLSVAHVTP